MLKCLQKYAGVQKHSLELSGQVRFSKLCIVEISSPCENCWHTGVHAVSFMKLR